MPGGNVSPNRVYIVDGQRTTLKQLSEKLNLSLDATYRRLRVRHNHGIALTMSALTRKLHGQQPKLGSLSGTPSRAFIYRHMKHQGKSVAGFRKLGHRQARALNALYGRCNFTPAHVALFADYLVLTDDEELYLSRMIVKELGWNV